MGETTLLGRRCKSLTEVLLSVLNPRPSLPPKLRSEPHEGPFNKVNKATDPRGRRWLQRSPESSPEV